MLKKALLHPPTPGAPRRAPSQASFSLRSTPQRTAMGKGPVSAGSGRAGEMLRLGVSLTAAATGKGTSWRAGVGRVR